LAFGIGGDTSGTLVLLFASRRLRLAKPQGEDVPPLRIDLTKRDCCILDVKAI
jgi:hypothetical protein